MTLTDSITGESLFAEIVMLRQVDARTIVLVEGVDDNDTLYAHIDQESSRLVIAYGKRNLERAVQLADDTGTERVLGIRDRDFIGILDPVPDSPNLVLTDRYDLDATVILRTDALAKALPHLADMSAVVAHVSTSPHASPSEVLLKLIEEISLARFESHRAHLGLRLTDFPVHEVATSDCHAVVWERFCEITVGRSDSAMDPADLARRIQGARQMAPSCGEIACGHDLIGALAYATRSVWGGARTGYKFTAAVVRSALSCEQLKKLELYNRVILWETRTGGRVWACR